MARSPALLAPQLQTASTFSRLQTCEWGCGAVELFGVFGGCGGVCGLLGDWSVSMRGEFVCFCVRV